MTTESVKDWVAVVGGLLTAVFGLTQYFKYRSRQDRLAAVGAAFTGVVDGLASDNVTRRMAAAVLLRRFFSSRTEQGMAGTPYSNEAVALIAGMLREEQPSRIQKVLADGLRYAAELRGADLQHCDLTDAFLGRRPGTTEFVDLSTADLFEANCARASFRGARLKGTVFYGANLEGATFADSDCSDADFRGATLTSARFKGAQIGGARFTDAVGLPEDVARMLDDDLTAPPGATVGPADG
jgi:uncharacterized protein YjbI with pentapeptide repeats